MSKARRSGRHRIAIIGGGLSGLTVAYEMATHYPDQSFTLFESSHRLGGIIETVHDNGFTIEAGPDSWVTEKPWARTLVEELALVNDIIPSNDYQRRTWIARDRSLLPMPDGLRMMVPTRWEPILHSPLLSWQARLAYLREPRQAAALKAHSLDSRGPGADESVADFVLRHFGPEVSSTLAAPLLSGVFGGDIARLSVRAVMAPFVRMEAEHGSLIEAFRLAPQKEKAATFTTLRFGLGTLIHTLVNRLPPDSIQLASPVTAVCRSAHAWQITAHGRVESFDAVLLATPAHVTRQLLASMHATAADSVAALLPVEASSALVVALGFTREKAAHLRIPRGFGFLVPQPSVAERRQMQPDSDELPGLLACTFVDQKFADRVPPGGSLLRGFYGGAAAEHLHHRPERELVQHTRQQLARFLGPLPEPDIHHVRYWPMSLPQYIVGHVSRIQEAETLLAQLPNLHLAGNAYHGVGLPDLVRDSRSVARTIVDSLSS